MYVSESCYFLRTCRKRSKQKDPFLLNSANLRFSLLLPSQSPHPHLLVWSKSFFAHFAFICSFLFAKRKRKKNYFKLFLVYTYFPFLNPYICSQRTMNNYYLCIILSHLTSEINARLFCIIPTYPIPPKKQQQKGFVLECFKGQS